MENANEGIDTVQSSISYTLGANVENLTLTGTAAITATGNTLNNILIGNNGNNILDGGAGVDTLKGGIGNDTYIIDTSTDTLLENANEGIDTVQSSITYTLGANLENLTLTGTAAINATGNSLNNTITGNSANNILNGGAGKDIMTGGASKDTFIFDTPLNSTSNLDTITDFNAKDDTIKLENSIFTKLLATGVLNSNYFRANSTGLAADKDDYIVYETDTGKLFYDADGNGSGAAIQIATLIGNPVLTNANFVVI